MSLVGETPAPMVGMIEGSRMREMPSTNSELARVARELLTELVPAPTPNYSVDPLRQEVTREELERRAVIYRGRAKKEVTAPKSISMAMFRRPLLTPRPLCAPKGFRERPPAAPERHSRYPTSRDLLQQSNPSKAGKIRQWDFKALFAVPYTSAMEG